jgi:glycosyltransferase involved in cell wall biosynthesis
VAKLSELLRARQRLGNKFKYGLLISFFMVVLNDVSLCMIVRDEIINPLGGIGRFLDLHLPYFSEAVVVDTGSIDGTRDVLDQYAKRFPQLRVYDHMFDGFGNSRNFSLEQVRTSRALILDADEMLDEEDFCSLERFSKRESFDRCEVYNFGIIGIFPDGTQQVFELDLCSRLVVSNVRFYKDVWELIFGKYRRDSLSIFIKHFLPNSEALYSKRHNWYQLFNLGIPQVSPSLIQGFEEWKRPHPNL